MAVNTVRVQINGVWTALTKNATTGKYEGTIAAPSTTSYNVNSSHYYPVTVEATDRAGNVITANDTHVTLGSSLKLNVKELTKPTIVFTAPASGAYLSNNKPTVTFQLRDEANGSGIKISSLTVGIDGSINLTNTSSGVSVTQVSNGYDISIIPPTPLSDGSHTFTVNITDNDGNAATSAARQFYVDTIPPTLSITTPAEDTTYRNTTEIAIVGKTNDSTSSPVTVTIKLNSVDQGIITVDASGNFTKSLTLKANVTNIVEVFATDLAGQVTSISRYIVVDTIAPVISSITIAPNPVNVGQSYIITVDVSDT